MKDVTNTLKIITEFQQFAIKRGYQLLMAQGCKWKMYDTPETIQFDNTEIEMTFIENTNHDCRDHESVSLTILELEKSESEWRDYIETTKKATTDKEVEKQKQEAVITLKRKEEKFDQLKKELNK